MSWLTWFEFKFAIKRQFFTLCALCCPSGKMKRYLWLTINGITLNSVFSKKEGRDDGSDTVKLGKEGKKGEELVLAIEVDWSGYLNCGRFLLCFWTLIPSLVFLLSFI